jgi:hypothetical protein
MAKAWTLVGIYTDKSFAMREAKTYNDRKSVRVKREKGYTGLNVWYYLVYVK